MGTIGATRDLTQSYKRLREHARAGRRIHQKTEDKATARLVGAALTEPSDLESGLNSGLSPGMAPDWVLQAERIRTEMGILQEKLTSLKEWHNKKLLVSFETDDVSQQTVEVLTQEIKHLLSKLDREIQRIVHNQTKENEKIVSQVQRQLAQALYKISLDFRRQETHFLNKLEEQKGYERGHFGLLEESEQLEEIDVGFSNQQLTQLQEAQSFVAQRDEEIQKIVETITDLAQIMKDLSVLVVDQGSILDRIDHNIDQVDEHVKGAVKELTKAEDNQKRSRSLICIGGLMIAIFIVLLYIIFTKT